MPSPGALYASGVAAYRAATYDTAADLFTEAISLAPTSAKLYDARAGAYDKLGRLQDGLIDAREVVRLVPSSHKGYLRAAKMLKTAGRHANAEKLLQQGLERVPEEEIKGRAELEAELATVTSERLKAEHSPFSQLPFEIFVEIITLATEPSSLSRYSQVELPRTKPPRVNTLFSSMRVSRTWYQLIKATPHLWTTLCVDGVMNQKNAERKVAFFLERANQGRVGHAKASSGPPRRGIRRLVLTAAQDLPPPTFAAVLAALAGAGAASTLREVVLSFVDGSRTTVSVDNETARACDMLVYLHEHCRETLDVLSVCSGSRIYPDFDLTCVYTSFPNLTSLSLWGTTSSSFVLGLHAPFLRTSFTPVPPPTDPDDPSPPPVVHPRTNARHLRANGVVFIADVNCHLESFPHLVDLDFDIIGAPVVWPLLSAPNLRRCNTAVYGEAHVAALPMPDLAQAWARLEHLRLGGAKRLAPRLLDEAIRLGPLRFDHLTHVDLSFASLSSRHLTSLFDSGNAPCIETLNLASTMVGPPESALVLPRRMARLRALNVSHTMWVTDATIRAVAECAPRLERLEARGSAFITGRPVMELVRGRMPVLADAADVEPEQGKGEGDKGARKAQRYSLVTDLALEGCTKIEAAAVEWLKKHVRPGGVRFQFVDPNERRGRSSQWAY
ncbi:uncharacterized protein RHOBADRAFT_53500 [Rhodotorula graminis WP1]|uniref:Uncharacterized protein n=1 Tax=Rhodotorula graminis (strain WP1) TaxID=578459 RepID=A0A194S4L9_RHOGW|nr:uncharacterized protein RHOBADRAFT_53500 [Rhodotorula graminis WP1]KPV75532.1 hypothetical protein RHOBADRAFT_53500 [Rhodotorula graminis WP1]